MVEASVSIFAAVVVLVAAAGVLGAEWRRTRCVYLAFEEAHLRLTGRSLRQAPARGWELRDRVGAEAHCGGQTERVELPRLEYAKW